MAAGILAPASGAIRVVGMDLRSHLLECSQRTGFLSGDTQLCQRP
jgi:ABC-type multidrug transport system ATPase subunit